MTDINLVDKYDLACVKDELERKIITVHNNEICPIRKGLQLHRFQIDGLGDVVVMLGNEYDKIKLLVDIINNRTSKLVEKVDEMIEDVNEIIEEVNEHSYSINSINNIFALSFGVSIACSIAYFWNS